LLTACLLAPGAAPAAYDASSLQRHTGIAHDARGRVLYRETHYVDGASRLVLYRCSDGRAFARKRVDGSGIAPDFDFLDGRDGYREGVRNAAGGREVYWRAGSGKPQKQAAVAKTAASVFDAGFDAYVRQHWTALAGGTPMRARFLVPSRMDAVGIRLQSRPGAPPGFLDLAMRLDAWYGFALPEFRMRYRKADRWLARFEGIGTIRDASGAYPKLRIDFPDRPTAVGRAELQEARTTPLADACGSGM
jgi:hypothetical protein